MSNGNGKKKSKVFFVLGNGSITTSPSAPGDRKMPSAWNPGRSRNKYRKVRVSIAS